MSATFYKGTKRQFFKVLGVNYGYLALEDYSPVLVLTKEQSKNLLHGAVERELLTGDEASCIEGMVAQAGIAKDMATIFETVKKFSLPEDFSPSFRFEVCSGCYAVLTTHGAILEDDKPIVDINIATLVNGFLVCAEVVHKDPVHMFNAVAVFKQMLETKLPADEEEAKKRYNEFPEETRRAFERHQTQAMTVGLLGVDGPGGISRFEVPISLSDIGLPPYLARLLRGGI